MQRLNVRNIPDEIYRQFEQEAARQERSTEALRQGGRVHRRLAVGAGAGGRFVDQG